MPPQFGALVMEAILKGQCFQSLLCSALHHVNGSVCIVLLSHVHIHTFTCTYTHTYRRGHTSLLSFQSAQKWIPL